MSESQAAVGPRDTASIAHARPHGPGWPVATIGALGVVFGDIGTSPIYTIQTIFNPEETHTLLTTLGIFGASLFLADSMITPAISVLSAVERLRVVRPELEPLVIPITVVIIVALFAVQRVGTARVGRSFGPVMALWFISIGLAGAMGIAAEPGVLRALSPMYAISFLAAQSASAFFALAAVVLAITGRGSYLC